MNFEDFIKSGQARRAQQDISLAKSLLAESVKDQKLFDTVPLTELSARKLVSNHYDILRSILEAVAIFKGYKIYSHEAFTYYLKFIGEDELAIKFERLRKIRNGINYYAKIISIFEAKDCISEIKEISNIIIDKYLKELSD